jgi:hypothetical protein
MAIACAENADFASETPGVPLRFAYINSIINEIRPFLGALERTLGVLMGPIGAPFLALYRDCRQTGLEKVGNRLAVHLVLCAISE